jgi:hypothetical protein
MMAGERHSYPSLIVEVILAVLVCRRKRFSMLIEATLHRDASVKFPREAMRFRSILEQSC